MNGTNDEETAPPSNMQKQGEAVSKSSACKNHLGYLGERSAKTQIPDECLTCKQIVQCMLKKATEQVGNS